ncbi:hypothetical protein ACQVP2_35395 [Methylobacterium aquaticum]|uniref:hypothetical protein n=1 Tax=Methylobacterium aquaticum TaxID=270351 RepID=UPI003D17EB45
MNKMRSISFYARNRNIYFYIKIIVFAISGLLSIDRCLSNDNTVENSEIDVYNSLPAKWSKSIIIEVLEKNLEIKISSRVAGAVESLVWAKKEFINSYDHGRELQSAVSFDGFGECLNPTEAGSEIDGRGSDSSSKLEILKLARNSLSTRTKMAYWKPPAASGPSCPKGPAGYTNVRTSYELEKKISVGVFGLDNVIEHSVKFIVPTRHNSGVFEASTMYLVNEFDKFWVYDVKNRNLKIFNANNMEQEMPVVISTADKNYAVGVYSPDLPQKNYQKLGYGVFRFPTPKEDGKFTSKWNCVFRMGAIAEGEYNFRCFIVVGKIEDVKNSLEKLAAKFTKIN